jgi:hypothetical protein
LKSPKGKIPVKDPIIFRRRDCLNHEQALYWKDLLYRTVKVGTELEYALPKGAKKEAILSELIQKLNPSGDINRLGRNGVLDVASEHCGFEIRVIGRQPYYRTLLEQYQAILNSVCAHQVRARFTCGLHYHLLTIGLGETMPEIILANYWNLVRRYAPNLKFLTSTGNHLTALTRRRNHNSHLEMVKHTPSAMKMQDIQTQLRKSASVPEHQNFFNLEHVEFTGDGQIQNFHIELRFPDADLSPTSIVAKTFLFLALLLKAVEISQYGIIHVGRIREWRRQIELLDLLSNNEGMHAASDTSGITPEMIAELRQGNRELMELVKPVFSRFQNNPCFEVLAFLAENPVSLLLIQGHTWEEIERLLQKYANCTAFDFDVTDTKIIRTIELALLTGKATLGDWRKAVAFELGLTPLEIEKRLAKCNLWRGVSWDAALGTLTFLT